MQVASCLDPGRRLTAGFGLKSGHESLLRWYSGPAVAGSVQKFRLGRRVLLLVHDFWNTCLVGLTGDRALSHRRT